MTKDKEIKNHIFILNGVNTSGKNTFVDFIKEEYAAKQISIVDYVKDVAKTLGWNGSKEEEKDRRFLSDLKLALGRYDDSPFTTIQKKVRLFNSGRTQQYLFIDMREADDIERAVKEFGAYTILVRNNNVTGIKSNMADRNVENYGYDFIIENNGTLEELKETALFFIENWNEEDRVKEDNNIKGENK